MPRLTDIALQKLPAPARGHITHWDEGSPLGVRVSSTGFKTFIVIMGSGKRHRIGRYGDITLAQARSAAVRLRAEKTLGRLYPASISVEDARKLYLDQLDVRRSTKSYYERHLNKLPRKRLTDLTAPELLKIIDEAEPASKMQITATFRAFFNWCVRRHYLDTSPCARMDVPTKPSSRTRILSDQELQSVWQACEQRSSGVDIPSASSDFRSPARTALPANFATIVKLLILTGQRRSAPDDRQKRPKPHFPFGHYGKPIGAAFRGHESYEMLPRTWYRCWKAIQRLVKEQGRPR